MLWGEPLLGLELRGSRFPTVGGEAASAWTRAEATDPRQPIECRDCVCVALVPGVCAWVRGANWGREDEPWVEGMESHKPIPRCAHFCCTGFQRSYKSTMGRRKYPRSAGWTGDVALAVVVERCAEA
jgi:hypothetical protein